MFIHKLISQHKLYYSYIHIKHRLEWQCDINTALSNMAISTSEDLFGQLRCQFISHLISGMFQISFTLKCNLLKVCHVRMIKYKIHQVLQAASFSIHKSKTIKNNNDNTTTAKQFLSSYYKVYKLAKDTALHFSFGGIIFPLTLQIYKYFPFTSPRKYLLDCSQRHFWCNTMYPQN